MKSDYLTDIMLFILSLKVQCNTSNIRLFKERLVILDEKCNSHGNIAFLSSLEDTPWDKSSNSKWKIRR